MSEKKVIKINKAKVIGAVFDEVLIALQNDYDSIWNGMYINLLNKSSRYTVNEDDTFLIDDGSGEPEELLKEEIEDLICTKIMIIQDMIEKSLDATNDKMILILDE